MTGPLFGPGGPAASGRPVILGEYPYYRADPARWADNVDALARAGIDVVTCYLPWRFHETAPGRYDFTGRTSPQHDVRGLLRLIAAAGLGALLKPGPFVHGEVQFGGLPDRVSPSVDPGFTAVLDAHGRPATSGGLALPSPFCPRWRTEAASWLSAVAQQVVLPSRPPAGPVVAVQLGNEGIYSDAQAPADAHDFSAPALQAFAAYLHDRHPALAGLPLDGPPPSWPAPIRSAWAGWSGAALRDHYRALATAWPAELHDLVTVNLPLPAADAPPGAGATWFLRTTPVLETGFTTGYTSWVGNASRSSTVCARHWFGVRALRASNLEENWGFTWTDPGFARPGTPLFHALLGLALQSRSCSVYTACATETWGNRIDLDPDGLRGENRDPRDYAPPYCPGAPLHEDGSVGANLAGLQALAAAIRDHGPSLTGLGYAADLALVVPAQALAGQAWPGEPSGGPTTAGGALTLEAALQVVTDLQLTHQYQVDVLTERTAEAGLRLPVWLVLTDPADPVAPAEQGPWADLLDRYASTGGRIITLHAGLFDGAHTGLPAELPPARWADPHSDPALILVHEDSGGQPRAVFAFNPSAGPVTARRRIGTVPVVISLAPGAAVWLRQDSEGFTPVLATHQGADPPQTPTGPPESPRSQFARQT